MAKIFLIETYRAGKLIDISRYQHQTKEEAENEVKRLYEEQKADNDKLIQWQADQIESMIFDESTDDKIPGPAYQYNYTFKVAPYSKRAANKIP